MSINDAPDIKGKQVEKKDIPKIGDVVTATLVGGENGEPRQGIFAKDNGDGTMEVLGESGETYTCLAEKAIVVPEKNLWGSLKELYDKFNAPK